jgi:hypothetical protein
MKKSGGEPLCDMAVLPDGGRRLPETAHHDAIIPWFPNQLFCIPLNMHVSGGLWVVPGSRFLPHVSAACRVGKNTNGVLGHVPKRLPSILNS